MCDPGDTAHQVGNNALHLALQKAAPPQPTIESIIIDPGTSYWMRDALDSALTRDPVDAASDAELLAQVLRDNCTAILAGYTAAQVGDQTGRKCIQCGYMINTEGHCGCITLDDEQP